MKNLLLASIAFMSLTAQASPLYAIVHGEFTPVTNVLITGAAAEELYAKLNVPETEVRDEHGGPVTGTAKFGVSISCVREYGRVECQVR